MEHRHALSCLECLIKGCRQDLWQQHGLLLGPDELVKQLQATCWRCLQDTALLRLLLQVLQALADCLVPCLSSNEADDAVEEGGDGGFALLCKLAVGMCLRLLLVQLPGSDRVPLLIRGLALQVGTH